MLAAHFTMVHKLQRDLGFLRTPHNVLAIGYLQPDRFPTCGKKHLRKWASLDKTDLTACVTQRVEDPFHFPKPGTDLPLGLPLAANLAYVVQDENLWPFEKLNQRLTQRTLHATPHPQPAACPKDDRSEKGERGAQGQRKEGDTAIQHIAAAHTAPPRTHTGMRTPHPPRQHPHPVVAS